MKSAIQKVVALLVTEAETIAVVICAQDMLYNRRVLLSMSLKVNLPMVIKVDNGGAVNLSNNWSAGGRTRLMDQSMFFLRNLKEVIILGTRWIKGTENPVDMFTKKSGSCI